MYLCMYTNIKIKVRIRWCSCRVENILTLGKLLRLWFCFLLHSILFFISQTSYRTYKIISSYELARPNTHMDIKNDHMNLGIQYYTPPSSFPPVAEWFALAQWRTQESNFFKFYGLLFFWNSANINSSIMYHFILNDVCRYKTSNFNICLKILQAYPGKNKQITTTTTNINSRLYQSAKQECLCHASLPCQQKLERDSLVCLKSQRNKVVLLK